MPITVLVGCQWGDEGKGKIVDLLSADADWVARFQGGANAGHTVFCGERRAVLHLVPTGILRPGVGCAIGNGVVLDPLALLDEIRTIEDLGIEWRGRLRISPFAHVVTPLQKVRESLREQDRTIGTTRRGIGPTYESKAARDGLRVEDLLDEARFRERLHGAYLRVRAALECRATVPATAASGSAGERTGGGEESLTALPEFEDLCRDLAPARKVIAPLVCDVTDLLLSADDAGETIICEGAQGALLDVDHGSYPFVTSSNTTVGGACTGLGIPPKRIGRVVGVVKAYTTRVGHGPFPTEFAGEMAERFGRQAGEFGATTGRPRRCGWFDAVLVRRTIRINGVDELIVTKMDVLRGLDPLRVAVAYQRAAPRTEAASSADDATDLRLPSAAVLEDARPRYVKASGWQEDLSAARTLAALPAAARAYLECLEEETGANISMLSVGPGRDQVVSTSP
jgi:adenylosuccinate synthase